MRNLVMGFDGTWNTPDQMDRDADKRNRLGARFRNDHHCHPGSVHMLDYVRRRIDPNVFGEMRGCWGAAPTGANRVTLRPWFSLRD